ncbi:MAG: TolC family protein [Pseudomonadota bacterium]|nr:TolC family protein [Pseudomonadota bacterium]MDP2352583.1 TolC family protein [Pseudomonadota bacterium]
MNTHTLKLSTLLIGVTLLGGCASFSPDGGLDKVADITRERMAITPEPIRTEQDSARVADEVKRLLAEPLNADSAVRIAILNNRGLQASLAGLGIAEADLVQAGRMHNPGFSFGRLAGGGEVEFERKFLFDLMGLLTLPTRSEIERRRFEGAQLGVAGDTLRLAQTARQAYFSAVAARQATKHQEAAGSAAEAAADLAKRMADVGNFSKLRLQREQLLHAEMGAELARARQNEANSRERLIRVLGLAGAQRGFTLPDRLPELPAQPLPERDIVQQAMASRLDLRMARLEIEGLAKSLGLTRSTRFINVLDASYLNKSATGAPNARGYEIELVLPIFDWGDARAAKAEALYTQAMHRVAETAVNAESEVRDSHGAYRTAFDLARRYRDEIVPLRKSISEETMLRYNGMLIGVWDLLADVRQQIAGSNAAIQAQKDFWVAESNLQMSLNGSGAGGITLSATSAMSAEAGGGH